MEYLIALNWNVIGQIVLIDILLGGDNAVVIALACRGLAEQQRRQGVIWGTAGAIGLRLILILFAVFLLQIPFLKFIGGILLLWIGIKLTRSHNASNLDISASTKLVTAIKTIIVADFVMSLDNVIAIAGATEASNPEHRFALIAFGLILSIPIIVFGSQIILKVLDRFPWIVIAGAALLGWIAGGLVISDPFFHNIDLFKNQWIVLMSKFFGLLLVLSISYLLKFSDKKNLA